MTINKIELQDSSGNILYPHTNGSNVDYDTNTSVNDKIDEAIQKLIDLKTNLATSINNKAGSSLTSNSTIQEIVNKIDSITTLSDGTNDATATASQILSGSTAYSKGSKVTGTMANNSAVNASVNCGGSYTIPAGYHNGSGKVTGNSLASQTSATATAANILSGKTAWVSGSSLTGTMPYRKIGASGSGGPSSNWFDPYEFTYDASAGYLKFKPAGTVDTAYASNVYLTVSQATMANAIGLTAGKIVSGNTILGVAGTATLESLGGKQVYTGSFDLKGSTSTSYTVSLPFTASTPTAFLFSGGIYSGYSMGSQYGDIMSISGQSNLDSVGVGTFSISNGTLTIRRNTNYVGLTTVNYIAVI